MPVGKCDPQVIPFWAFWNRCVTHWLRLIVLLFYDLCLLWAFWNFWSCRQWVGEMLSWNLFLTMDSQLILAWLSVRLTTPHQDTMSFGFYPLIGRSISLLLCSASFVFKLTGESEDSLSYWRYALWFCQCFLFLAWWEFLNTRCVIPTPLFAVLTFSSLFRLLYQRFSTWLGSRS